jgi:hypothetical protein
VLAEMTGASALSAYGRGGSVNIESGSFDRERECRTGRATAARPFPAIERRTDQSP